MSQRKIVVPLLIALFFITFPCLSENIKASAAWSSQGSGNRSGFSSPAVADLDGNLANGKEVVAVSINGVISAFKSNGDLMWEAFTPSSGCGGGRSQIHSSPAVGAIYGDGKPYVVVGYGNIKRRCDGGILVLDGTNGKVKWRFSTKKFAKKARFPAFLHTVFSSPAIADTDGKGKMQIGFGSFDRTVYLLNHDGSIRWYYQAADTVWSSPTFAKIDNSNELKMIVATDISKNNFLKPATKDGGNLYAFHTKANPQKKYGFRNKKAFLWMRPMPGQVLFSSPKVADVMPQNPGLEIVLNTGCYFPNKSTNKAGRWTRVVSAKTGKILRTLPIEACSSSSPALADLNGDGYADIVVTVNGARNVGGDGSSRLKAFDGASGSLMWSIIPKFRGKNYHFGGNFISPKVVTFPFMNTPNVVVPIHAGIGIYDGLTGQSSTCESAKTSGCSNENSLKTPDVILNTAAIDDFGISGDSYIVASGKSARGKLGVFRWKISNLNHQDPDM